MPMPLPEERVYYFELRECGNVLLCWIPREELEAGVAADEIKAEILEDYPGGLDVEVTPADTRYLKKRYGLQLGLDPEDLLLAFEAITASSEVDLPGEVRGETVEELARDTVAGVRPKWNERRPISKDQAEVLLGENPAVQRQVDKRLRSLRGRYAASEAPGSKAELEGLMQRIRCSKGDPPEAVFTRLQRQVHITGGGS